MGVVGLPSRVTGLAAISISEEITFMPGCQASSNSSQYDLEVGLFWRLIFRRTDLLAIRFSSRGLCSWPEVFEDLGRPFRRVRAPICAVLLNNLHLQDVASVAECSANFVLRLLPKALNRGVGIEMKLKDRVRYHFSVH